MNVLENLMKIVFVLVLSSLFMPRSGNAYEIKDVGYKVKTGQLPVFCRCAGHPPPDCSKGSQEKHFKYYGQIFSHIHHYCWGLDKLNAQLQSGHPKEFWLKNVLKEFDYVLNHKDPKRSMHAQVWAKKGQVLLMLKRNVEAVDAFSNAIKSNKHYIPPYVYLSQYLKSVGDNRGACKILTLGVQNNPDSKNLKQYLNTCQSK